jgi:tyrosinase
MHSTKANSIRGDISAAEKKEYIAAMLCLMEKPSKLDPASFPGATSRFEDFVVVHMNQTMNIHGTVGCPIFKL